MKTASEAVLQKQLSVPDRGTICTDGLVAALTEVKQRIVRTHTKYRRHPMHLVCRADSQTDMFKHFLKDKDYRHDHISRIIDDVMLEFEISLERKCRC